MRVKTEAPEKVTFILKHSTNHPVPQGAVRRTALYCDSTGRKQALNFKPRVVFHFTLIEELQRGVDVKTSM